MQYIGIYHQFAVTLQLKIIKKKGAEKPFDFDFLTL